MAPYPTKRNLHVTCVGGLCLPLMRRRTLNVKVSSADKNRTHMEDKTAATRPTHDCHNEHHAANMSHKKHQSVKRRVDDLYCTAHGINRKKYEECIAGCKTSGNRTEQNERTNKYLWHVFSHAPSTYKKKSDAYCTQDMQKSCLATSRRARMFP